MTNKELVKALSDFDDDQEVYILGAGGPFDSGAYGTIDHVTDDGGDISIVLGDDE